MIQDAEFSTEFQPLCVIHEDSRDNVVAIMDAIEEAYRYTIPGHVVDCVSTTIQRNGLNKFRIVCEEHIDSVDDEGYDCIDYRTFTLFVTLKYAPMVGATIA